MPATTAANNTHLPWWTVSPDSAVHRVKLALQRQLEQTKSDLGIPGAHDLNQTLRDTVHQILGWHGVPSLPLKLHPDSPDHAAQVQQVLMAEHERARLVIHHAEYTLELERAHLADGTGTVKHMQKALADIERATRQRDQALRAWRELDAAARYSASVATHKV